MVKRTEIEKNLVEAIRKAETELPPDVVNALKDARKREEEGSVAKSQFDAILKDIEVSKKEKLPLCQDTGTQTFFVTIGTEFKEIELLKPAITNAVRTATDEVPLRPNTVDPFAETNPGDNTGRYIPNIIWDLEEGDKVTIDILPKGGGGENMSALKMLNPTEGIEGAKKFIIDHVAWCGGKPCPPTVLGVCIGGGADLAMRLAKKALIRKVGERHPDEKIATLEEELLETVNSIGIGPMGLGGNTTVLDIHIEWAHRHPASFPLGIITQCWADRRARLTIHNDGSMEVC